MLKFFSFHHEDFTNYGCYFVCCHWWTFVATKTMIVNFEILWCSCSAWRPPEKYHCRWKWLKLKQHKQTLTPHNTNERLFVTSSGHLWQQPLKCYTWMVRVLNDNFGCYLPHISFQCIVASRIIFLKRKTTKNRTKTMQKQFILFIY